jgi:hypothetical protein
MWAQLIHARLKPGADLLALADVLKAAEQPGSRELDPRRAEGQQAVQSWMAQVLAASPEFIDLTVAEDWVP